MSSPVRDTIRRVPDLAPPLLTWFDSQARELPWRRSRNPYHIWVSEIMLQQTQVETVIPYYERWLARFPTVLALAEADQHAVLHLWQGLGYYARARNLHAAARQIVTELGGELPTTRDGWLKIKGVGRYTAGAIASIAFDEPVAVVDGNVKRVLARLFDVDLDIKSSAGEAALWALAEPLVPAARPGDYNQGLMELGATICRPKNPACLLCPLHAPCLARQRGLQHERPVVKKRAATPHYDVAAGIIRHNGRILIAQRPADKLLGSLWEFPGGKADPGEALPDCLQRELREELAIEVQVGEQVLTLHHAFTHFRITLHVFLADWLRGDPQRLEVADFAWVTVPDLASYPMGKTDRDIAEWLRNT